MSELEKIVSVINCKKIEHGQVDKIYRDENGNITVDIGYNKKESVHFPYITLDRLDKELLFKINLCDYSFSTSYCKLENLNYCPRIIQGDCAIQELHNIKDLRGNIEKVYDQFSILNCSIETLDGCPEVHCIAISNCKNLKNVDGLKGKIWNYPDCIYYMNNYFDSFDDFKKFFNYIKK